MQTRNLPDLIKIAVESHFKMTGRAIGRNDLWQEVATLKGESVFEDVFDSALKEAIKHKDIEPTEDGMYKPFGKNVKKGPLPKAEDITPRPYKGVGLKKLCLLFWTGLMLSTAIADVVVTKVEAKQRYPWNGLVDITVTLTGDEEDIAVAMIPFYATNKATRAELPVNTVTSIGSPTRIDDAWTRRFIWNATADVGRVRIAEVELTVGEPSYGVQLWEGGPYWAECNVGATKPEEHGYYFWWGDTVGYKLNAEDKRWVSVVDGTSRPSHYCSTENKSTPVRQEEGYVDETECLAVAYDAATAHLGSSWRMPTNDEFSSLLKNCDTMWTERNGVNGRLVRGRGNYSSKCIFFNGSEMWISDSEPYRAIAWGATSSGWMRGLVNCSDMKAVRPVRRFNK